MRLTRLIAAVVLLPLAALAADDSDITEVSAHRTPGKPMMFFDNAKPAEEVAAVREKDGFALVVRVNVPRDGVTKYTEERAPLAADEWKELLAIVADEKLLDWKPELEKGQVFDWGSEGFAIRGKKENSQGWSQPVANGAGPRKLSAALAALVKKKTMKLRLFYFG